MKQFIALLLCTVIPIVGFAATDSGYKIRYDGGSLAGVKSGNDVKLYIEEKQIRVVRDKKDLIAIQAAAITEVSYG